MSTDDRHIVQITLQGLLWLFKPEWLYLPTNYQHLLKTIAF